MKSNKIVIALFGKLKGNVIDWFDLKYKKIRNWSGYGFG